MAQNVVMPKLGLTMSYGTVTKWLKKEGDRVAKGEVICEVETEKINNEVESPVDGILLKIVVQEGNDEKVLLPIAVIGEARE
jgi:pyruvate dehydrogenase E2 component (dihydrolipoamide acetyltransferase)